MRRLLQEQLPAFDDEAVDELWRDCRRRVPDVTPEEVSAMFASKLPGSQSRSIENPNGFLIKAVARSCTPAAIGALRQGREVAPEIPIVISAEDLEEILADPNMPEDMRKLAEERLKGRTR